MSNKKKISYGKNITFAYFAEIINDLDKALTIEEFAVSTFHDAHNKIIIDLDNKNILIGARHVA